MSLQWEQTSNQNFKSLLRTRMVSSQKKADGQKFFIYPGISVQSHRCTDQLNFHLPESTLVMLVSALAGREHVLAAYETAVEEKYRFFSFGDAMFIVDRES